MAVMIIIMTQGDSRSQRSHRDARMFRPQQQLKTENYEKPSIHAEDVFPRLRFRCDPLQPMLFVHRFPARRSFARFLHRSRSRLRKPKTTQTS